MVSLQKYQEQKMLVACSFATEKKLGNKQLLIRSHHKNAQKGRQQHQAQPHTALPKNRGPPMHTENPMCPRRRAFTSRMNAAVTQQDPCNGVACRVDSGGASTLYDWMD